MMIDFAPIHNQEIKLLEYSARFDAEALRNATHAMIDTILDIISDADDAQIAFLPYDPEANDPYATEEEKNIGWSLGHLVAHTTATCEEWAAYSSILARGVPYPADPRLRYETPWREMDTKAKAVQRLEESRRIRLGYLSTWPDAPNLTIRRDLSPRYIERFGEMNATACYLMGLMHEDGHLDQYREVARQAAAAASSQS